MCTGNKAHGSHVDVLVVSVHEKKEGIDRMEHDREEDPATDAVTMSEGLT